MADADAAASIVNALQRHAAVVVQKSPAEGFGLTVVPGDRHLEQYRRLLQQLG